MTLLTLSMLFLYPKLLLMMTQLIQQPAVSKVPACLNGHNCVHFYESQHKVLDLIDLGSQTTERHIAKVETII